MKTKYLFIAKEIHKFHKLFSKFEGSIEIEYPNEGVRQYGPKIKRQVLLKIENEAFFKKVSRNLEMGLAIAYRDGDWEASDLTRFFKLLKQNEALTRQYNLQGAWVNQMIKSEKGFKIRLMKKNRVRPTEGKYLKETIDRLLFNTYDSYAFGYFRKPEMQFCNAERLRELLQIKSGAIGIEPHIGGSKVGMRLAKSERCQLSLLTQNSDHFIHLREAVLNEALKGLADVKLESLSYEKNRYDFVLMMENMHIESLSVFINQINTLLKLGGKALLQVITINSNPTYDFFKEANLISQQLFPGLYVDKFSALTQVIDEHPNLTLTHMEEKSRRYTFVLQAWRQHLFSHRKVIIAEEGLGFYRALRHYLAYCEAGFSKKSLRSFQLVLSKDA